eukprot:CAMPEP_0173411074 /NCGR_PEP_ID=MMETSP1356-20130122/76104_1 /TAXON_ID=77927 ORGANISM="Hemiselmis virescens, Strain PCC157" /NCGR_SAMPLE_ID=MMETSP1356 /ASSEMBLY_ACC=CAM_ASM_000847 /LENGTH=48 /DNA_ID= /DNA_START= /DNA_END= /DNA_ORIENTATION=
MQEMAMKVPVTAPQANSTTMWSTPMYSATMVAIHAKKALIDSPIAMVI